MGCRCDDISYLENRRNGLNNILGQFENVPPKISKSSGSLEALKKYVED